MFLSPLSTHLYIIFTTLYTCLALSMKTPIPSEYSVQLLSLLNIRNRIGMYCHLQRPISACTPNI